jgi:hypothetical protein
VHLDSSIIKVDENSIVKILQSKYDLSSFEISIGIAENVITRTIVLNESDLIFLNIFNNNEKIIFILLLITTQLDKNTEEKIYICLDPNYVNDFNKFIIKTGNNDHNYTQEYLFNSVGLKIIQAFFSNKKNGILEVLEIKIVINRVLEYFGLMNSFEIMDNKSKLLLNFIDSNNSIKPINYGSFSDYLRSPSNINQEFSNLDNFIFQNRPDVVRYCSQPLFEFKMYQKWLVRYGIEEYGLPYFLNEQLILSDGNARSENKLLINCRDFKSNGLAKLKDSLTETFKNITPESVNSGVIFSIGGALEFSDIYPLNIFADDQRLKVAIWVWELNIISAESVKYLRNFDEIWTLSVDSQFALQQHGIPSRVVRFPLEVGKTFLPASHQNHRYFLAFVDFDSDFNRKNPISTILAFQQAFESEQDINLVIKISHSSKNLEQFSILQDICRKDNRIIIINRILSDKEIFNLFDNCLAFISSHRAEGLGFNIIAAINSLKPAVISKFSAPIEYLPDNYHYFVPGKLVPIKSDSPAYILPGANWFDPNINEIAKLLCEIYCEVLATDSMTDAKKFMKKVFNELNDTSIKNNILRIISKDRLV